MIDWTFLAAPEQQDERMVLSDADFNAGTSQFLQGLQTLIDNEHAVLVTQARKLADAYWNYNHSIREEGNSESQGYFGTRVKVVGTSISCEWYINRFAPNPQGQGKKRVFSTYLPKGKGLKYPSSTFNRAKDWEKEAIEITEDKYAVIRAKALSLSKLRRNLTEYSKIFTRSTENESS